MKRFISLILFLVSSLSIYAFFDLDLRTITKKEGLADNTINTIYKGLDGFMWFGTENGLSRYDGKHIQNFKLGDGLMSISRIRETPDRKLWLIVNGQICCFDRCTAKFIVPKVDVKLNYVNDIQIMPNNIIYVLGQAVFFRFRIEETNGCINLVQEKIYDTLQNQKIHYILCCKAENNQILALTSDATLVTIDTKTADVIKSRTIPELYNSSISGLFYDNNKLWVYVWGKGIYIYNTLTHKVDQYTIDPKEPQKGKVSHTDIYAMDKMSDSQYITVGWSGYTIFREREDGNMPFETRNFDNTTSQLLKNVENHMSSVFYDPQGILWIGTIGGGIIVSDLRKKFYKQFFLDKHNEICAIANDDNGYIYYGTFHQGLYRSTTPATGAILDFEPIRIPELKDNIFAIAKSGNKLWIVGKAPCLICYDTSTSKYISYKIELTNANKWVGTTRTVFKSDPSTIWLGNDGGLIKFDTRTEEFFKYDIYTSGYIRAINQTDDNHLWIGAGIGLLKFDIRTGKVEAGYEDKTDIQATSVRSLLPTSDQRLYVGYSGGLAILSLKNDSIINSYTTNNGLIDNFIGCLACDNKNGIWLGSNSGISQYDKTQDAFFHYYISGSNRSTLLYDNTFYWGNNKSLTYFNTNDVNLNSLLTGKVFITNIEINGRSVAVGDKINDQTVLDKSLYLKNSIKLNYVNNSFAFLFSNLYYNDIQKYSYRLFPYTDEWSKADEGEKILYTNMKPGEYIFEIKSMSPDDIEGPLTQLKVKVSAPWYQTLFFYILCIFIFIILVLYIIKRLNDEKKKIIEEQKLKQELLVVNIENEKAKKINKEREIFFINISHELRTPLTLIQSPLQSVLEKDYIPSPIKEDLNRAYDNTKSLTTMIDKLLYLYKFEAGAIQFNFVDMDIVELVSRTVKMFKPLALQRMIHYSFETSTDRLVLSIDVEKIEQAIQNLISNALKYTPEKGSVSIKVDIVREEKTEYCQIRVSDTGYGIETELQDKLFDPFVVGAQAPSYSTQIGFGLTIVKDMIEQHKGKVLVESEQGIGSKFSLLIPTDKRQAANDSNANYQDTKEKLSPNLNIEENQTLKTYKLLIIEDNIEVRKYICSIFSDSYIIIEAENGYDGIDKAIRELPDLIITDIMMPIKDGFEVGKEIRARKETAHIPLIMLSARTEDEDKIVGANIGADEYMTKPFNPSVLKAKVTNMIAMRQRLKKIYSDSLKLNEELNEESEDTFMQELINIIEQNLTSPEFSVKTLAQALNMSQSSLYRRLKDHSELTAKDIIRNVRITKSAELILKRKYQIQEIAYMVGYNDVESFRKHFTSRFGVPPSLY